MPRRATRKTQLTAAALIMVALLAAAPAPAEAATRRANVGNGMIAVLNDDLEIHLQAVPQSGEGLYAFSERLTGSRDHAKKIRTPSGKAPRRLMKGVRYQLPFAKLTPELQLRAVRALFPDDEARPDGWLHRMPADSPVYNLWSVSLWFTGSGQSFSDVRDANQMDDNTVTPERGILIPRQLLAPLFAAQLPAAPPSAQTARAQPGADYTYDGQYLIYKLKKGEALYSNVVMRFNGSTFAKDVNALAFEIARLNKIRDVKDMPVGQRVKVPFDLLLPEYLPRADPRRLEYEKNRSESAKYSNTVRTSTLDGITVILDAGHGGEDPGAMPGGVREAAYVYDIMLRTKEILEARTAARVIPTTRDGSSFEIVNRDKLPVSRGHAVLTHPPYKITDSVTGTHLRWYLANSVYRAALAQNGKDPLKTIFISLHADSLHSSVRGAMAYVPDTGLTKGAYAKSGSVYEKRQEFREQRQVSFSWKDRVRSEGLSRELASKLLASLRRHGFAIHNNKPIRDRVVRCRRCRPWVPAVVRRNAVPAKLLLEVCNLNNAEDRRLLQTRGFRQKAAEAIVAGILDYYGESVDAPRVATK